MYYTFLKEDFICSVDVARDPESFSSFKLFLGRFYSFKCFVSRFNYVKLLFLQKCNLIKV